MSEEGGWDGSWAAHVARVRGVTFDAPTARELAALVAPTLRAFSEISAGLRVDDDEYEFLRVLAAEAAGGA